jgi:hypothetical protein
MLIAGYTGMVDLYSPLLKSNIGSTLCVVANVSGRSPFPDRRPKSLQGQKVPRLYIPYGHRSSPLQVIQTMPQHVTVILRSP